MRTTYRVYFIDRHGYNNKKLLEADTITDVCNYMSELGYEVTSIEAI
jgi:hypothetical protein